MDKSYFSDIVKKQAVEKRVSNRIVEIAAKHCADYPNVEKIDNLERLYAIECTLEGLSSGINDLHKIIDALGEKYKFSNEDIVTLAKEKKLYPYDK